MEMAPASQVGTGILLLLAGLVIGLIASFAITALVVGVFWVTARPLLKRYAPGVFHAMFGRDVEIRQEEEQRPGGEQLPLIVG